MSAPPSATEDRIGAAIEFLAVLALMYGFRFAAQSMGFTRDVGSVAIVLAVGLIAWLLARRSAW